MKGRMAPLKKPRNSRKLPLALNPMKSKDVLAVLAERNQAIVPVGAWVEPASPNCSEIPAHASAYVIEEELKEQRRRKQESLKHFQRQVKNRVNQQVKLRKKQQLQKSYKVVENEGSVVMQCLDSAHLTPERTDIFPSSVNAPIRNARLPSSQVLEATVEDEENQNQLFQQQAQALSQTMKQARHQLASFKTVSEEKTSVFLNGRRKSSPTQEDLGYEKISSVKTDNNGREDLFLQDQQDLLSENKDKPFSKIQKVKFKNPLFVVIKEEPEQLNLQSHLAVFPGAQDYLLEVQGDLIEPQCDVIDVQNVEKACIEAKALGVEPDSQDPELEVQTLEPKGLSSKMWDISLKAQASELDGNTELEAQDLLPSNQAYLSRDQDFLSKCQDQDSLSKVYCILPKYWTSLPKYQDQNFVPIDQEFLPRNQLAFLKEQSNLLKHQNQDFLLKDQNFLLKNPCDLPQNQTVLLKYQDEDFLPKDQNFQPEDQYILPIYEDQDFLPEEEDFLARDQHVLSKDRSVLPKCQDQDFLPKNQNNLCKCKEHYLLHPNQKANLKLPASILKGGQERDDLPPDAHQDFLCCHHQDSIRNKDMILKHPSYFMRRKREGECHQCALSKIHDQIFPREQYLYFRQQPSVGTVERWRDDLNLGSLRHLPHKHRRGACSRRQVSEEYQSGLGTEFLTFRSGVEQEEDKKEHQKQYLRHRRPFMDIEREQVKEQKRQKEQKKKIEKIKKKKEQQRYAEEQRILRMNFHEEPYSGEKISDILAQLQLEEIKGAREKQHQREKEYVRYVEALRAQVREKMKLYNITLPPLCCCGPDFWDAHPDTCANNCIFYKNYRAYNRALYSVISSSDISEGNSTLRNAIRNFASAHKRTSKKSKECQQSAVSLYAKPRQLEAKWMPTAVSAEPASQSTT